ncbi:MULTISPECIES: LacI family DNA-binding transcriptional regulator [Micromonospora]|uniref:LacI family DNA-binding transcriptional regulator n=1 Tax=Micromonospora TaxID=1873 RepID=UPI0010759E02|nr:MULTISPECIES: LacI family DNA-binding transcriptional regulator [unclassified Micromonospora]MBF5033710.1 LacI family DNA-binding transcriptional regulator [Micromonospora sp. ANENR4]MCZ7474024.1 LacI family DNA-binding transcriptional regulator [Micromonospora sp. WMMC273]MDW3846888.1 LacI family transcriptional regulator [Micromonospora sp. BRA006-A]WBC04679.1 LacI family DNA-binding transcriptional regulator [Micromonospora sp. WMMA1976]
MTTQRTRSLGRPTLDAVAARAGVGRGTVSRVVNGSPQVSPEARAAVQQAIAELGYVPNRAARALVTQRTDSVALVVSESGERVFTEPFFAAIVRGVSSGLVETPMQLWLAMVQSPIERERVEHHLTNQHVDGVLLLSLHDADPLPTLLEERGLPTVLGGRPARMLHPNAQPAWFVDMDNVGGARQAVEHLFRQGRRRVATIAGPQDMGAGLARLSGYQEAVRASGSRVDPGLIAYGDFSEGSGTAAMRRLLDVCPELDAVFVASDLMAFGALRALREAGRRVPEDVAVIGFDDAPIARQAEPPLTTVFQPVEEMGRQMARLLVSRIRGEEVPSPHVLLDTELIHRASA